MPNQTLVSVPTKFDELKQVRMFVVKLVEKLDIVLGYRGTTGYEEAGTAEQLVSVTFASLAQDIAELATMTDSISTAVNAVDARVDRLSTGTVIADTTYTAPAIAAVYNQAQVQGLADDLETVSDKLDALLVVLRSINVIN